MCRNKDNEDDNAYPDKDIQQAVHNIFIPFYNFSRFFRMKTPIRPLKT